MKISLDRSIYSIDAVIMTAYQMTDDHYIFLYEESNNKIIVRIKNKKNDKEVLEPIKDEFLNKLIDNSLRVKINEETKITRDTLVRTAMMSIKND